MPVKELNFTYKVVLDRALLFRFRPYIFMCTSAYIVVVDTDLYERIELYPSVRLISFFRSTSRVAYTLQSVSKFPCLLLLFQINLYFLRYTNK
jgi:hypothetical protein